MPVKIFAYNEFIKSLEEEQFKELVKNFREYKETGVPHETFGRDVPYLFPFSVKQAELQHMHIKDATSHKNWHLRAINDRTSDTALIYCQGAIYRDYYMLIGYLENAHQTYVERITYLPMLAEIAEKFRTKY